MKVQARRLNKNIKGMLIITREILVEGEMQLNLNSLTRKYFF